MLGGNNPINPQQTPSVRIINLPNFEEPLVPDLEQRYVSDLKGSSDRVVRLSLYLAVVTIVFNLVEYFLGMQEVAEAFEEINKYIDSDKQYYNIKL